MKLFHKILILTAICCFAILPDKESSAQDIMTTEIFPQEVSVSKDMDSIFLPNEVKASSLKGDSFNENVTFAKYQKNILQEDTHTLELQNLEKDCDVSFKSSDSDILSVEQLSNVSCSYTGTGYGTAKITVTISRTTAFFFKEKKTMNASIHVTPKAVSVMFRQNIRKIGLDSKNKKLPLIIRPSISKEVPTFKSLNKKIVTINKQGKITAKKTGTTYITATLLNGKSAKCKIIVTENFEDEDDDIEN